MNYLGQGYMELYEEGNLPDKDLLKKQTTTDPFFDLSAAIGRYTYFSLADRLGIQFRGEIEQLRYALSPRTIHIPKERR